METKLLIAFGLFVCLALSFVLSGMEAGVFALSRLRIRQQMRAGNASARVLHQFLENPENFFWTIVVGNTLVNFVVIGWFFRCYMGRWRCNRVGLCCGLSWWCSRSTPFSICCRR
jgi:Mg2+/Co2+ transporter CorB